MRRALLVLLLAACGPKPAPAGPPAIVTCQQAMEHLLDIQLASLPPDQHAEARAMLPDIVAECEAKPIPQEKLRCAVDARTEDEVVKCDGGWDATDDE